MTDQDKLFEDKLFEEEWAASPHMHSSFVEKRTACRAFHRLGFIAAEAQYDQRMIEMLSRIVDLESVANELRLENDRLKDRPWWRFRRKR